MGTDRADLVERLRHYWGQNHLLIEAADALEAARQELMQWKYECQEAMKQAERAEAECKRLAAEISQLRSFLWDTGQIDHFEAFKRGSELENQQ